MASEQCVALKWRFPLLIPLFMLDTSCKPQSYFPIPFFIPSRLIHLLLPLPPSLFISISPLHRLFAFPHPLFPSSFFLPSRFSHLTFTYSLFFFTISYPFHLHPSFLRIHFSPSSSSFLSIPFFHFLPSLPRSPSSILLSSYLLSFLTPSLFPSHCSLPSTLISFPSSLSLLISVTSSLFAIYPSLPFPSLHRLFPSTHLSFFPSFSGTQRWSGGEEAVKRCAELSFYGASAVDVWLFDLPSELSSHTLPDGKLYTLTRGNTICGPE